jgi:hypothetical protein
MSDPNMGKPRLAHTSEAQFDLRVSEAMHMWIMQPDFTGGDETQCGRVSVPVVFVMRDAGLTCAGDDD